MIHISKLHTTWLIRHEYQTRMRFICIQLLNSPSTELILLKIQDFKINLMPNHLDQSSKLTIKYLGVKTICLTIWDTLLHIDSLPTDKSLEAQEKANNFRKVIWLILRSLVQSGINKIRKLQKGKNFLPHGSAL